MSSKIIQNLPRRSLLSLAVMLSLSPCLALSNDKAAPIFLSAATDSDDKHWLKAFTIENNQLTELYSHQLRARAHAATLSSKVDLFVAVARRPGRFMVLGDTLSGNILQEIEAPEGRHFYGHGVFSSDDEFFYTTESAYDDLQGDSGRIGVWRVNKSSTTVLLSGLMSFPVTVLDRMNYSLCQIRKPWLLLMEEFALTLSRCVKSSISTLCNLH